ncbi:MAG: hypothetical protein DCC73_14495 [Proteobacteria bacterium]|nr:MAG: hypothetical protein DCC73_14495 [Pseudomonadota bacterium]
MSQPSLTSGGCLCGNIRYESPDAPENVHFCHCTMCRKISGGPFAYLAGFKKGRLRFLTGEPAYKGKARPLPGLRQPPDLRVHHPGGKTRLRRRRQPRSPQPRPTRQARRRLHLAPLAAPGGRVGERGVAMTTAQIGKPCIIYGNAV